MFSMNALIASAAGAALVALWARYSPKVAAWLLGIPERVETGLSIDLPDWFVDGYKSVMSLGVMALNDVLGNKGLMSQIVNKIRKNKGDEAAEIFITHVKEGVSVDKIESILPPDVREWFNAAREDIVVEAVKAKVDESMPLLPQSAKPAALAAADEKIVRAAVRASVVTAKIAPVAIPVNYVDPEAMKKHMDFLSAEGRAKIEEMRARYGMAPAK